MIGSFSYSKGCYFKEMIIFLFCYFRGLRKDIGLCLEECDLGVERFGNRDI